MLHVSILILSNGVSETREMEKITALSKSLTRVLSASYLAFCRIHPWQVALKNSKLGAS
jgi:hypothetical protein